MRAHVLASLALVLVAGCSGSGDDLADTDGLPYLVDFRIWRYENGHAELEACLYRFRWCEEAGTVEVEHGTQTVTLATRSNADAAWYEGSLDNTQVDDTFRFTWSGAGDQSSVTGEVDAADSFTISSPSDGSTVSATAPLIMEWTGGADDGLIAWGYRADCPGSSSLVESFAHLVPDSGEMELPAEQLSFGDGCAVELWLERIQRGSASAPHVNILSSQARFVNVFIGP